MVRSEKTQSVQKKAEELAEERLLDILLPPIKKSRGTKSSSEEEELYQKMERTRGKLKKQLNEGQLDDRTVEINISSENFPMMQVISPIGIEEMGLNIQDLLGPMIPKKTKKRKMTIPEAKRYLIQEESQKLIDMDEVIKEAIERVENTGIVFLDEIDKIAGNDSSHGPDVSRSGVQRDLLPVVEGTNIITKYGMVKTDHVLFIASGAFHMSKPSDLIPELQGRFPIRVELNSLTTEDFVRILIEPENALIKQYIALMETENVKLSFTDGAIREIAHTADVVNNKAENIGARRLHTVMTTILEEILFELPADDNLTIEIDENYVKLRLNDIVEDEDLSRYIL